MKQNDTPVLNDALEWARRRAEEDRTRVSVYGDYSKENAWGQPTYYVRLASDPKPAGGDVLLVVTYGPGGERIVPKGGD